jgi:glycosyl transferase family 25
MARVSLCLSSCWSVLLTDGLALAVRIINLERALDRRNAITGRLEKVGLPFEIFKATDGRALTGDDRAAYDRKTRIERYGYDLGDNEIACHLSHLRCITAAHEQGYSHVLVLEDDVDVADDLPDIVQDLLATVPQAECVRLCGLRRRRSLDLCPLGRDRRLVRLLGPACGSQAYILNRRGMEKVMRHGARITVQFDIMLDRYWRTGLEIHAVLPYPVSITDVASTITKTGDPWRKDGNRMIRLRLRAGKWMDRAARSVTNARVIATYRQVI